MFLIFPVFNISVFMSSILNFFSLCSNSFCFQLRLSYPLVIHFYVNSYSKIWQYKITSHYLSEFLSIRGPEAVYLCDLAQGL